ncbi:extracellular elastinolytic metallo proteinase [Macrolepiota fuliginosa MF-IS2]|uniref:Extracellular metalloproteinase n=1 Tax=Macrolepiota fuliginosa MF-IS2 TaxID=1400762 RepID=A0A9P6C2A1_9AGAR|nr:extracellular elastinolytic metallo proteinase [Macrolepiota fuliginosa MF-IS2]
MRCLLTASLVFATLAGSVYGHSQDNHTPLRRRKTLGFGPEHPHAVFKSNPYQIQTVGFTPSSPSTDPYDVARLFVTDVLGVSDADNSWKIRKDSYTDENTGVTHIYVRQVIHGLEVADGDMNINIKDGRVLSYGNSFYSGRTPAPFSSTVAPEKLRHPHTEFCGELHNHVASLVRQTADSQVVMDAPISPELAHIIDSNCAHLQLPASLTSDPSDFRPALLQFMVAATPNRELAEDIMNNYQHHINKMAISDESHFAPSDESSHVQFKVDNVPDAVNPVKARLAYIQVPNEGGDATELQLVWKFEVEMEDNWYESAVTAAAPHRIVSVVDWASDSPIPIPSPKPANYKVYAWGVNDPECGKRTLEEENFDALASPAGWHAIPYGNDPSDDMRSSGKKGFWRNTTSTWGNNVFAQENWEGQNAYKGNYRPDGGPEKVFDFKYNPRETERDGAYDEAQSYINATVTQLFYTNNLIHDFYYRYGFNEVAGNFQQYNFGRGGEENDAVIANAQDGSGYNNANFMTPPDGSNGRMRMYLWNTALPYRDGDFEAGIVIHEYSHGLSTRLTGGPANSGCLGWGESGGMGEGWGDFLATTIRANRNYSDYAMGAWAANREDGIRNFIYSTDDRINPSTYKTLDKPGYWGVHAIGEVWAEILWVVSQRLIEKHGYSDALFPPAPGLDGKVPKDHHFWRDDKELYVPRHGNTLAVQLVINGMKLQPCRPSFFDSRDAIIEADRVLTDGENVCLLWKAFAERGLGVDARVEGRTPWGGGIRTNVSP